MNRGPAPGSRGRGACCVTTGNAGEARTPEWLSTEEAVEYLRFPSRDALYQAVQRGQVPTHRLGRRLRFRRVELEALLKAA